jgi:basic amino acid/polyamine antiporter, APA family
LARLKRALSLFQVTVCGVGIILGAGIYALVGLGAGYAGPALWLSFLISGIIAAFTALSYAELSSIFREDAGEYDYVRETMGKTTAIITGLIVLFLGIFTAATVSLAFGGYFNKLVGTPILLTGIGLLFAMTVINYMGIKESATMNLIFTAIESAGLLIIIVLGIKHLGSVNLLEMPNGMQGVFQATALIFFAYIGFEAVVKFAEETKNPEKNIPRGVLLSLLFSTIVYVLVAIAAVSIMPWFDLSTSQAPLADVAAVSLGVYAFILLGVIALFSTANTVLMDLVTISRMAYGIAVKKALPNFLTKVHGKTKTPHVAIFTVFIITVCFMFIKDLEKIANIADLLLFIVFILVNIAVIVYRYKRPNVKRPFKMPLNIGKFPVLALFGLITSFMMIYFVLLNLKIF